MSFLESFFGGKHDTTSQITTVLDLMTYAVGLASNPNSISKQTDAVRNITSRLQPGQPPSAAEEQELFGAYLQVETYLTTEEPLRHFTKPELRKHIAEPLLAQLTRHETSQAAGQNN